MLAASMPLCCLFVPSLSPSRPLQMPRDVRPPPTMDVASPAIERRPLFSFEGASGEQALDAFERIDDVIMGGVSSSRLVIADDASGGAFFEGRLREQGGGFCGQRMKLLSKPLDLSSASGLYLELDASEADPSSRVFKVAMRTRQDRGEVVYQSAFKPSSGRELVCLPFETFRLVRGPRLVPGVPPLDASQANETYQISLVISKFEVSESGAPLLGFREGPFRLRLYELGAFVPVESVGGQEVVAGGKVEAAAEAGEPAASAAPTAPTAASAVPAKLPPPLTEAQQAAATPPLLRLLRPLLGALFGEKARRRRAATLLLEARGTGAARRVRLAWAWRAAGRRGALGAAAVTAAVLARDVALAALSVPVRLLFRVLVLASRALKAVRQRLPRREAQGASA